MVKGPAALLAAILATTIVVLPTAAPAQAVITPPPIVEPTATVHGVVKDTAGAPIPGACVDVAGALSLHTLATTCVAEDGAYALRVPANHQGLRISARATGLNPVWWPNKADHESGATGFAADEDRAADFVLGGAVGTLSGSVARQDGEAERYAWINLYPVGSSTPSAVIIGMPNGTFSRADIPVGRYEVEFSIDGYAKQWHPATAARTNAATITISVGQPVSLTEKAIAVAKAPVPLPAVNVVGVVKAGGQPLAGAEITALNHRDGSKVTVKSDAAGNYRLDGLVAGCNYALSATAAGRTVWAAKNVAPEYSCIAAAEWRWDPLIPDKAGSIKGLLRSYDGGALPKSTWASLISGNVRVGWIPIRLDGTYEFNNVPVGFYTISFRTPKYTLNRLGNVSVTDGTTTEVTDTSLAPTYLEITVKAKDTGNPIGGACITATYGSGCANPEGIAFIGPMWTQFAPNRLRVKAGVDYFGQDLPVTLKVGQVNPFTFELSPGAMVTFPVAKAGGEKFTDQICVYAVQSKFTASTEPAGCAQANADGIVRVGPFQPGTARLLIVPSYASHGAQWLGPKGGTGQMEKAAPIDLRIRQTATAPKATMDSAGMFTAHAVGGGGGLFTPDGCLSTAAGRLNSCGKNWNNELSLGGLGPYEWPITWRPLNPGYGRTTVLSHPRRVDLAVAAEGKLTVRGPFYQNGDSMPDATAFDAYTGEVVSNGGTHGPAGVTFDGLGNGQVVIAFHTDINGKPQSCWLKVDRRPFKFSQPYFSTTAGKSAVLDGVTCTQQEPLQLKPVEPSHRRPASSARTATTVKGKLRGHSA